MKILGTLTVDTPNALDKVTDLNADLLDGKSSELFLSRSSTTGVYIADTAIIIDNSITPTAGGGRLKIYDRDSIDTAAKGLSIGKLYSDNAADITTIDADLNISLATGKDFKLFTNPTGVASTNRLTVLSTGNVGINKANPTAKLQVHGGATETTLHPLLITASTKTLFDVDFSGNIGINTAANVNVQLLLQGERTSTHSSLTYGIKNDLTYVADTGVVASIYSMYIGTTITASNNFATAAALFINEISVSGGASTTKYGIYQAGAADSNVFHGNVGIGTSSPTKKLQVFDATNSLPFQMSIGTSVIGSYDIGRNPTTGLLTFYGNQLNVTGYVFGSINGERMRIDYNGNVGIGTNAPFAPLDVSVNTSGTNNVIVGEYTTRLTSGTAAAGMGIGKMFSLEDAGGNLIGTGGIRSYWVNPAIAVRSSNTDIQASLNNAAITVATFTSAGNVLIGKTTDDGNKLQVEGSASVSGNLHVNGGMTFGYGSDAIFYTGTAFDASKYLILQNNADFYGRVGLTINAKTFSATNTPSENDAWAIDPRSGIRFRGWLIGDVDYDTKFSIQHLLANATNAVGDLGIFAKGYSETLPAFVLAGGGNVGIGVASPTEKLHVAGNILATGTVSGGNISNSYYWAFTVTGTATSITTNVISVDSYGTDFSGVIFRLRKGDGVAASNLAPNSIDLTCKNVFVYRSTTTGGTTFEQVFPDIEISSIGHCTLTFATAQTNYNFRVVFA